MGGATTAEMFATEHEAFVALARGLTPEQWQRPSRCTDWTVRDVVVHAAFHIHRAGMMETLGSTPKYTARAVAREGAETIDGLLPWFASPPARSARASKINLCELVIHQQDARRPLESPRAYPEDTMRVCLDVCTGITGNVLVVDRRRRLGRELRLVATDLSWSKGRGPEVEGTGEALLMAIAGRGAALADLTGPGIAILADRLPTTPVSATAA